MEEVKMIKSLYTEITTQIQIYFKGGNYMKRRILTTLLTMCMVLILLQIPAYAGKAYCDICGKWVSTTGTYEYKDAGYHWNHVYCTECGTNISNPRSAHVWSGTATCTSGQTCTVCGGTSTPPGHDWSSNWISDENNHWHECNVCAEKDDVGEHIWNDGTITTSPTCTTDGERKYTCIGCGRIKTETIQATGHDLVHHDAQAATCTENGWEAYDTCSNCDYTTYTEIPASGKHTTKTTTVKATAKANGKVTVKCSVCDELISSKTIPRLARITLAATELTYNGKVRTPGVTVKDSKGNKLGSASYTVTYASGRKAVGSYIVKIRFKGNYSGTFTKSFTIKPKGVGVSSISADKKKLVVKWAKQPTQTTGYQSQYSTSSTFAKAKTVTIRKNATTSYALSNLQAKKKYYVRIRTYKQISKNNKTKNYFSGWSGIKSAATK